MNPDNRTVDKTRFGGVVGYLIIGLFVATFLSSMFMIYISIKTSSGVITDNSYTVGNSYGIVRQESKALGWHIQYITKKIAIGKDSKFMIKITDKEGKIIDKPDVSIWFYRPSETGFDRKIRLFSSGSYYIGSLNLPLYGLWEIRVLAHPGKMHFESRKTVYIAKDGTIRY